MSILTYNLSLKPFIFEIASTKLLEKNTKDKFFVIDYPDKEKYYEKFYKNYKFISHNKFIKSNFKKKNNFHLGIDFYRENIFAEKIYMNILSRYQINQSTFNFYDRNLYFKNILKYYGDFLVNNKIKWIIFYDYPHHIDSYPLYILAKHLKIKITIISYLYLLGHYRVVIDSNLKNRFILYNHAYRNKINKKEILNKVNTYLKSKKHIKPKYILTEDSLYYLFLKDLYRSFRRGIFKQSNFYFKISKKSDYFNEKIPYELKTVFINVIQRLKIKKLKKDYLKHCFKGNFYKKKFILFLPSVQPEASTLPLGGFFYDFTIIINMLLKYLPKNWYILYKEHPLSFNLKKESHLFKKSNFYSNLKNDRLIFIDYRQDTYDYIIKSECIATATGSAGLEALLKGKPVLNFGKAWWSNFSSIYTIQSDNDLSSALEKIKNNQFKPRVSKLKKEIINTFEKTIEFPLYNEESYERYLERKSHIDIDFIEAKKYLNKFLKYN